jgi:hypothetical protein
VARWKITRVASGQQRLSRAAFDGLHDDLRLVPKRVSVGHLPVCEQQSLAAGQPLGPEHQFAVVGGQDLLG